MGFLIVLLVIILIIAFKSIKIVKQAEVYVIERLGKFYKVADAGLTIIIPFFDHVRSVVSLKQQTMDVPPQGVITKDNVTITIDTVVFYQITDPAKAVYEIQSLKKGIEYLASEAQRQSAVTIAEGKKQAAILEAEADKEARITRAAGEAQAIKEVAEAKAKEIQMVYEAIKKSDPDEKLVQLKSLEALEKVADGEANKVFIPFEATSALSSLGAIKEVIKDEKKK